MVPNEAKSADKPEVKLPQVNAQAQQVKHEANTADSNVARKQATALPQTGDEKLDANATGIAAVSAGLALMFGFKKKKDKK
ncbi:hypothetical protein FC40_GL001128 [Ligilactobacillus hayakitensis DSM 18933 = JCM 14209]|uniref:Gram-positive cocci surface proteins LPxTG domain-containing protein n=3 Tax=Ligilactobacillus TaxID=2767887 RepID=A0A0R1WPF6_9LACO|nr:hypothetical protein FC40_GL001128 [Ligilactobacillus hayakitensis DSM 18933 = JCM 14209]